MRSYKENWLPHLKDTIPEMALGKELSMYVIALEGWRRGLILKFRHVYNSSQKKVRVVYTLTYKGRKTHEFNASRGDKVSNEAIRICMDKDLTRTYLENANLPVPNGKGFSKNATDNEIVEYANTSGYPLVLKPTDGFKGHGVIVNIKNETEFKSALSYVRHELNYKEVVVEDYFEGEDCRIYVIENEVIGAVKRVPANVVGDGETSINELIKRKNTERNNNPNHYKRPINIDNDLLNNLKSAGYTLDTVLKKDEKIYLQNTSNISSGAEPIDITDDLTDEVKNIAINATKAIPGLNQCAVDMLINPESNAVTIIEINSKPLIGLHLFPEEGLARDVPKAIIDYYFPETKDSFTNNDFYFDFKGFLNSIRDGVSKEVTIKKVPQYIPTKKQFVVSGDFKGTRIKTWIRNVARSLKLNGYVRNTPKGNISIVVAGEKENVEELKQEISSNKEYRHLIRKFKEKEYTKPVNIGFYMTRRTKVRRAVNKGDKKTNSINNKAKNNTNFIRKLFRL